MMKGNKSIRSLSVASPRMSRSKQPAPNTAGSRYHGSQKGELKTSETTSYLEVTALSANDATFRGQLKQENTYKMAPDLEFRCHDVQKATEDIMADNLHDKMYDANECKSLSQIISARILEAIKQLGFKRYKMVAVVSIGSIKERPGMQFGSRCLWNKDTDNFISAKYSNTSLFAVAMVYGLYYE